MSYSTKGFTLAELLIVITVMGILSSIVVVSLTDVSDNARTDLLETDSKSLFPLAVLHFGERGSYRGFCDDAGVKKYTDVSVDSGCSISSNGSEWVVWLKQEETDLWQCVDSTLARTTDSKSISVKPTDSCDE